MMTARQLQTRIDIYKARVAGLDWRIGQLMADRALLQEKITACVRELAVRKATE